MLLVSLCLALLADSCGGHLVEAQNLSATSQIEESHRTKDASQSRQRVDSSPSMGSDWIFAKPKQEMSDSKLDAKLADLLGRVGPDMKPASGFRDYDDISIEISQRAWRMMHERALKVASKRVLEFWPTIQQSLVEANVSSECLGAATRVSLGAKNLEAWAAQCKFNGSYANKHVHSDIIVKHQITNQLQHESKVLNSWGSFPPSGLFEGSLGDIGSYHGCINIQDNVHIRHAHYCTVAFRPVVPTRQDYDLIVNQEPKEILETFNSTSVFTNLVQKAQYYHYVYLKLGTCFPIQCTPFDVQKLSRHLAKSWFLLSGPIKCHSKFKDDYNMARDVSNNSLLISTKDLNRGIYIWTPHITNTQLVALVTLSFFTLILILITLIDLIHNRIPKIFEEYSVASDGECLEKRNQSLIMESNLQTNQSSSLIASDVYITRLKDSNNNDPRIELETFKNLNDSSISHKRSMAKANDATSGPKPTQRHKSFYRQIIKDYSIITNTIEFFTISQDVLKNDILCVNGLRCITMSWIIIAHTIQYNDWSAFARIYEVETHLESLANQPLFNASYLVDTFFLISGLLTSYSVFRTKKKSNLGITTDARGSLRSQSDEFKEILNKFSSRSYLIGRYLRLTPQIMLIAALFIILPLLSETGGPHWYTMTGEYSENCAKNWWINLLHIQAFYKSDEMCNFVCWWISVDMLYHVIALLMILVILRVGPRYVIKCCLTLSVANLIFQAGKHYQMSLPPNLFSTIPQTGAMWSDMTLKFFWTPVAHAFPFLFGFYTGFCLAKSKSHQRKYREWFNIRRAIIGWVITAIFLVVILYGTYFWVTGRARYTRVTSTCFYILTQSLWSLSISWIIVACEFGFGGFIASILSCKLFLVLGRASYLVYLSHFMILFTFFGSQNLLVEPTQLMITYIVIGNICISMMFGSILCIVFEMPWLKIQRRIMRRIR